MLRWGGRCVLINCRRSIPVILCALFLSGCGLAPKEGENITLKINAIPTSRQAIEYRPGLNLAIQQGVSREQMKAGKLFITGCYIEKPPQNTWNRRFGFTVVPDDVNLNEGDTLVIAAQAADEREGRYARFFGVYQNNYQALDSDYFEYEYATSGKAFSCKDVSENGLMKVEVYSKVHYWDYDFAVAEIARNKLISDDELRQGRIAEGVCSPGVDSWAYYNIRIPENMNVELGDYVEVLAGATSRSIRTGNVSSLIRKIRQPAQSEFIHTQGSMTVSCKAKTRVTIE